MNKCKKGIETMPNIVQNKKHYKSNCGRNSVTFISRITPKRVQNLHHLCNKYAHLSTQKEKGKSKNKKGSRGKRSSSVYELFLVSHKQDLKKQSIYRELH